MIQRSPASPGLLSLLSSGLLLISGGAEPAAAQEQLPEPALPLDGLVQPLPDPDDILPPRKPPEFEGEEGPESPFLPAQPSVPMDLDTPPEGAAAIFVQVDDVIFEGNTAFTDEELQRVTQSILSVHERGTVADIYRAAAAINEHYQEAGYLTTGTLPQIFLDDTGQLTFVSDGTVTLRIFEGSLEAIAVFGTERLSEDYIRSRLELATQEPLNEQRLLDALQLLYNNPLIDKVDAILDSGTATGSNTLSIRIEEADSFQVATFVDNQRSPTVSTFQQGVQLSEGNLLGLGDRLAVTYSRTEGSNGVSVGYTVPLNPQEGSFSVNYSYLKSRLITPTIAPLDIRSTGSYLDVTWRQPLVRTPRQEFTVGVTGSYRQNQVVFGESIFGSAVGFPSPGADADGRSRVTALRFSQDWVSRNAFEVAAVRSLFSVGLGGALGGTVNDTGPDNRFLSWRGQVQYQRRLKSDVLLSLRGDLQVASRPLLPVEQFGLGGQRSVRGYRQDLLLADNGAFASAEVWFPVTRFPEVEGVLYLTPFVDVGEVWNVDREALAADSLASAGVGLRWQQANVTARLDWGIPLIEVAGSRRTWQENGFHFSLSITDL